MNKIYLLLGSNMGNSTAQLDTALLHISATIGKILATSGRYTTAAWGNTHQPDFLNQVVLIETALSAADVLGGVLEIEQEMGRVRTTKNAPRVIDIDVLFFNDAVIDLPNLIIPHPEIANRRFVLVPMNEVSPALIHPVLQKNIQRLLEECTDPLSVNKF